MWAPLGILLSYCWKMPVNQLMCWKSINKRSKHLTRLVYNLLHWKTQLQKREMLLTIKFFLPPPPQEIGIELKYSYYQIPNKQMDVGTDHHLLLISLKERIRLFPSDIFPSDVPPNGKTHHHIMKNAGPQTKNSNLIKPLIPIDRKHHRTQNTLKYATVKKSVKSIGNSPGQMTRCPQQINK